MEASVLETPAQSYESTYQTCQSVGLNKISRERRVLAILVGKLTRAQRQPVRDYEPGLVVPSHPHDYHASTHNAL
jgi:hypothetical protein